MARFTPPWLDKVKFIAKYYISGCEAPLGVYAEKAVPQAKETVMILTTLGAADIVKEIFRPKGLRSMRHGRKGRKSRGGGGGIPDFDQMTAKVLREDLNLPRIAYSIPAAVFYVVDDVIDRIVYTVMITEMLTDLVYESLLGVLEVDKNFCPNIRRMWRTGDFSVQGNPGGAWGALNCGALRYKVGIISDTPFTFALPKGQFSVTLGVKMIAPASDCTVQFRFKNPLPPFQDYALTEGVFVGADNSVDQIVNCEITGPANVAVQYREDGSFWDVIRSDLMVLEII